MADWENEVKTQMTEAVDVHKHGRRSAGWRTSNRRAALAMGVAGLVLATGVTGSSASDASTEFAAAAPSTDAGELSFSLSLKPGEAVPLAIVNDPLKEALGDDRFRGEGIDVALIDTGVVPIKGLHEDGKVIYGPDLSNEGGQPNLANLDTFGHGTHMAGIIAGNDGDKVGGVAQDSRIVSLKVAGATGETHVSQVIAAIDWVVEHKTDNGMNIRVLNLSLGAEGVKTNQGDPLSAAVERAWHAGIVVVAAAGNRGNLSPGIDTPAISPYVLAIGGTESFDSSGRGDIVGPWSSSGNRYRTPDVVAPGRSIMSFRVPGSTLDQLYPTAIVDDRYFRGTGTSQSAAVMSGLVARILSVDASLTPDQVKLLLSKTAVDIAVGELLDGRGRLDATSAVKNIERVARTTPTQKHRAALPDHDNSMPTWSGGTWNGASWSGGAWSGASWSGASWSGASWSGASWSGASWSGASWSGGSWSGASWSGASWSGASWSGASWSGASWSSASWSAVMWS